MKPSREEVLRVAKECGFVVDVSNDPNSPPSWHGQAHNDTFERFAAAMYAKGAEAERAVSDRLLEALRRFVAEGSSLEPMKRYLWQEARAIISEVEALRKEQE